MGVFTWTDATVKNPRANKWGEYRKKDVIGYDCYCKVVCPDNSIIEEPSYYGYGVFGNHDVYELVVDWNREDLPTILNKKLGKKPWDGKIFTQIMKMCIDGISDEEITAFLKDLVDSENCAPYLIRDWKRNIGIIIACEDEDNKALKYPIKITRSKEEVKYDDLFPSLSTQ